MLWISDEDAGDTVRRNLEVSGANLAKVLVYEKDNDARLQFPAGVERVQQEITGHGVTLVIVDPITAFIHGSTNAENVIRAALGPLTAVAERTGSAIVLVRHLRKGGGGSALHRGLGSIGLTAAARSGLLVGAEPSIETEVRNQRRIIAQFKSSLGPLSESLAFKIVTEGPGVRVEWLGTSPYSAEQLASGTGGADGGALHEACVVLFSLLGEGPLWVDEVKPLARRAGIADRTLQRAKKVLGVQSYRKGFGPNSKWYWALPTESEVVARLKDMELDGLANNLFHDGPVPPPEPPSKPENRRPRRPDSDGEDPADWWKGE